MNENDKLNIGLDYHGVITDNIQYFRYFCASVIQRGHNLFIITGGPLDIVTKQLKAEGITYTKIFTIYDYYKKLGKIDYLPDGSYKIKDSLWNRTKAEYCKKYNIHIHIDDSLLYGKYFTTPYCIYDKKTKSCLITSSGKELDLHSLPPTQTIMFLENIFNQSSLNYRDIHRNNYNPN